MSNNIRSYFADYDVESMKKERERLKNYNPNGAPRKADNLDEVPSYEVKDKDK